VAVCTECPGHERAAAEARTTVNIGADVTTPTGRPGIVVRLLPPDEERPDECVMVRVVCWPNGRLGGQRTKSAAVDVIYRRRDVREAR
jgi:hypothetical protein